MKIRKNLSGQHLLSTCRNYFNTINDHRKYFEIPIEDALMSGLAIFKLKFPSLLAFEKRKESPKHQSNLKNIFGVNKIPSDTQLRDILDKISYNSLRPIFKKILKLVQRDKVLEQYKFECEGIDDSYLFSMDGTSYFSSTKIKCNCCLVKKQSGKDEEEEILYHHQMLAGAVVHPNQKTVIPMCSEPIVTQDGDAKNDCERNAAKRFYYYLNEDHPLLNLTILQDALYATKQNIQLIKSFKWNFIIGVKPGSNKSIFAAVEKREETLKDVTDYIFTEIVGDKVKKKRTHIYRYVNGIPFSQKDLFGVNFIEYWEITEWEGKRGYEKQEVHFSWITNINITENNREKIMRAGRYRWKEENEVFNTLKNHGYNLEHNYGHGVENLSVNFALLMMLAFLIDQVEEASCDLFKKARELIYCKRALWEDLSSSYRWKKHKNWTELLLWVVNEALEEKGLSKIQVNTS